jgi:hypothetical protein
MSGSTLSLEEYSRQAGFNGLRDFNSLVAAVPLSKPGALTLFMAWQDEDGTREGLLKAFPDLLSEIPG